MSEQGPIRPEAESSASSTATTVVALDPTGAPNLDQALGGGLPRGSLVIIVGAPGSGKTTLANQLAFSAAETGRRAIVLTALSEPTSKLIAHLRAFDFFDEELIGEAVQFLSLQQFLATGLDATGDEIVAAARRARASFVVLDGFRGLRGADVDPQAARQFLYDIGAALSVLGTTTIITSEADPRDPTFFPEATTGDVIIGLRYDLIGVRQVRGLEVIKMRGAAPLPGMHGMELTSAGCVIYPRLEAVVAQQTHGDSVAPAQGALGAAERQERRDLAESRAAFDLPELDTLLHGGLTRGTSTLVVGSLGAGKTTLGLHFALTGPRNGEPTVYVGFRESRAQLLLKADVFGMGEQLRAALAAGDMLRLLRWAPVELNLDVVANLIFQAIDEIGARRLVVDSVAELERAVSDSADSYRTDDYLAAIVEALRMRGVTGVFIREQRQNLLPDLDFADHPILVMAENVLQLRQVERNGGHYRVVTVPKMRFSSHNASALREFRILPSVGIRVLSPVESSPELLNEITQVDGEWETGAQAQGATGSAEQPQPRRSRNDGAGRQPHTKQQAESEGSDTPDDTAGKTDRSGGFS
ncbi:MAG: ATPase domain-containing protein [Ktedonobacterales bacterium]